MRRGTSRDAIRLARCQDLHVTFLAVGVFVLVVVLYALIVAINHADHFAPQAYHRRKRGGAPVYHGHDSLAPRYRKKLAAMEPSEAPRAGRLRLISSPRARAARRGEADAAAQRGAPELER